ncbi:MAG: signal transduction histidine kinase regulating C4-dicarboxylate transport system [Alphaproteobacteria bacterium]|nr:signal transduction histidine kinase regulating C4-dicarboxylate transport system [Alphaproteobacteria bacterium]
MFLRGERASRGAALIYIVRTALALAVYGAFFLLLHQFASLWGRGTAFSFWFPAAGLRFAVLWHYGPRLTLPATVAELVAYLIIGDLAERSPHAGFDLIAMALPPLLYGAVIALCKRYLEASEAILRIGSFPLILASVAAPLVAALAELPLALLRHLQPSVASLPEMVRMAAVFAVGDMTAVLLLSPPLIWFLQGSAPSFQRLTSPRWMLVESGSALTIGWAFTALGIYGGLGMRLVPVMLGVAWVGLRAGRAAAWLAVALTAAVALPMTADDLNQVERFSVHMLLVATAIIGNLVGAFSDSEVALREQVARRNRLLFHADRLRTLRAMSAAIIHEIGQPLSVISIEARQLSSLAARLPVDSSEFSRSASLVEQKVLGLAELVRRLRNFGEIAHRPPAKVSVDALIADTVSIARVEATARQVVFDVSVEDGLSIQGETLELQQAVLNVLRNAAQRTTDGRVALRAGRLDTGQVHIDVENRSSPETPQVDGMGIGLLVATSIVEAFGGVLAAERAAHFFCVRITFPGVDHV